MRLFCDIILYFFIYSFLGWICESIYCSIGNKKLINRGFLSGPICPVYGFGALIVIFFLKRYINNIFAIFIFGIIITSILEYITGYLLELIFHTKWWDYSKKKYNLHGRVCLKNSILFGFMSVILMQVIHKNILTLTTNIPTLFLILLAINNLICLIVDLSFTTVSINKLNSKVKTLDFITKELKNIKIHLDKFDDENLNKLLQELKNNNDYKMSKMEDIIKKIYHIKDKSINQRRLIKAFPNMKHKYNHDTLIKLKAIIKKNKSK